MKSHDTFLYFSLKENIQYPSISTFQSNVEDIHHILLGMATNK